MGVGALALLSLVANFWSAWLLWSMFPSLFSVPSMVVAHLLWGSMLLLLSWAGLGRRSRYVPALCVAAIPLLFSSLDGLSGPGAAGGLLVWAGWAVAGTQILLAAGLIGLLTLWGLQK